ncbi:hypothetical protein QUA41_28705 [Microcoleus sp. Pol11C1]|uniref:hypothetical protein n=1 Tax=unclassified Microcoleus TaxID=2642155 RepID=UPI002FD6F638
MITDEDLTPIDLSDFWDDDGNAPVSQSIEPDYIKRHIERIPKYGDDSRYRLASHLDMFESLNPDGTLTNEQREAVDNFVAAYEPEPDPECVGYEFDFPESQYIAHGLDLDTAIEFSNSWRRGEYLPIIGRLEADPVSRKLNQMQSQQIALRK